MYKTHIFLTPFNYCEWKDEMVIHLMSKCMYRITMGTDVEPNSAVEKSEYFDRFDEAVGKIFLNV